ncbi:MAG: nitrous oxide reductase accessory protein NosL [Sulfurimonas sp.]|uniref:nitrous oxide reductase accessory protein NosL n=1 Tax=Sulfurimonas sp. TaxID=2022749 RepID=UPI00261B50F9|nr:nitrous oxide reductase accessory protein NosL [Sulfurimonas sp.]MCW8895980.1 nitrous oxide reductase accessory protein NosL [Sulfurimonas sp.]MCW8954414.1 nitrous oxide reductase accessory protein NosL [Sulfurimonas sp.]MCW9067011.1 nitrous oxide reductase accessory protein NosL [Sulfurimonas sp.]
MLKVLSVLFIMLLSVANASQIKSTMFQSVSKDNAILLQDGKEKKFCPRCGMDLVKFYKTSHSASIDNKTYQYCSFHCLVDHLREGASIDDPQVVDAKNLNFIDIREAYYVVGSKINGTMTRVSKYAFSSENDAKEFKNENGGEIMNFFEAMEIVKKDFE